ncbi:unnamed protein product [Nippostrongylus brasiliensis]|uniref:Reverse transcriptase domain-containing protein n=1 Tax=Nippostrongylus brasiliensis TaxID=27835 RepID=A0A0N4YRX1_NIPBR|nr:unnamed protein product [Nippostrongylus brasiliensis]
MVVVGNRIRNTNDEPLRRRGGDGGRFEKLAKTASKSPVPWSLLYADGVMLESEDREELELLVQFWSDRLAQFGVRLSVSKTEYLTTQGEMAFIVIPFKVERKRPALPLALGGMACRECVADYGGADFALKVKTDSWNAKSFVRYYV